MPHQECQRTERLLEHYIYIYIFFFEGPLPFGSNHICKAYMPSPHTKWLRTPQKQHSKKAPKPGTYLGLISNSPSRSLTQASETAEAWPLVFRVLHAAKTAKNKKYKKRGCWKIPKTERRGHKEQGNGQQPSNMAAGRPPSPSDRRSQEARQ